MYYALFFLGTSKYFIEKFDSVVLRSGIKKSKLEILPLSR